MNKLKKVSIVLFQDPTKFKYWIGLGLAMKIALFIFKLHLGEFSTIPGFIGYTGGDTPSYLDPIDNWLREGKYLPDYRMPGYGFFYLLFRLFATKIIACYLLIIFQVFLAGISVYALALLAQRLFQSKNIFYITFFLYGISSFSNLYDTSLLTESLSVSFLIFTTYLLSSFISKPNNSKTLILLGIGVTALVFLRPVFAPLLMVTGAAFFLIDWKKGIINFLLFLTPFIIIDSMWIIENYSKYKKIIPLTKTKYYEGFETSIWGVASDFVQAWGGSSVYWDHNAEIRWLGITEGKEYNIEITNKEVSVPNWIFTKDFTKDSINLLRSEIIKSVYDSTMPINQHRQLDSLIKVQISNYKTSFVKEHKMEYLIKAPLILTKRFLIHSGTFRLFSVPRADLNLKNKIIQTVYSLIYLGTVFFGIIGIFIASLKFKKYNPILLFSIIIFTVYLICIHSMVMRVIEWRYLVPSYPFLTLFASYCIYLAVKKVNFSRHIL